MTRQHDPAIFGSANSISRRSALHGIAGITIAICTTSCASVVIPERSIPTLALLNGHWFDGSGFRERTVYSMGGSFTSVRPRRIDQTIDLSGNWVVPPFAEAHNHNIGTGVDAWDRRALTRYLADGVFYVKIAGNLPLSDADKVRLGLNGPNAIDAAFAQGTVTAPGGWPQFLIEEVLQPGGYFPGLRREQLADYRYFTIGSAFELQAKWPRIRAQGADFIKVFLWFSDEYERRRNTPQSGLDPRLLPQIVAMAHRDGLRVMSHVWNAADFHNAVAAGVDEIAHLPPFGLITREDAQLAARRGVVVVTTAGLVQRLPPTEMPREEVPRSVERQRANLAMLHQNGVTLAVGSDNDRDSSVGEVEYLSNLGVFDNLTLLRMWSQDTPRMIFPGRRIGGLEDGHEASMLALGGNPLRDWTSIRDIRFRLKQGVQLQAS